MDDLCNLGGCIGFAHFVKITINLIALASTEEQSIDKQLLEKLRKFCAYQERCEYEIRKKMKRLEIGLIVQDDYLAALAHERFWDEERFAKLYARSKFRQKHWGRLKIRVKLKERRLKSSLIEEALKEISPEDYEETITNLINKKRALLNEESNYDENVKIFRYLKNKGFEEGQIRALLFNRS